MERFGHHAGKHGQSVASVWMVLTPAQSLGWEHYEVHEPEPHILLFKCVQLYLVNPCADISQAAIELRSSSAVIHPPRTDLSCIAKATHHSRDGVSEL